MYDFKSLHQTFKCMHVQDQENTARKKKHRFHRAIYTPSAFLAKRHVWKSLCQLLLRLVSHYSWLKLKYKNLEKLCNINWNILAISSTCLIRIGVKAGGDKPCAPTSNPSNACGTRRCMEMRHMHRSHSLLQRLIFPASFYTNNATMPM